LAQNTVRRHSSDYTLLTLVMGTHTLCPASIMHTLISFVCTALLRKIDIQEGLTAYCCESNAAASALRKCLRLCVCVHSSTLCGSCVPAASDLLIVTRMLHACSLEGCQMCVCKCATNECAHVNDTHQQRQCRHTSRVRVTLVPIAARAHTPTMCSRVTLTRRRRSPTRTRVCISALHV
jgi:hypothetical protein